MTKRKYIIASLLKKIGVIKTQKRFQDAANEQQLLKQAEEILGRHVWTNLKEIDRYKDSCSKITKLLQEKNGQIKKITQIKEKMDILKHHQDTRYREVNQEMHKFDEVLENQKQVIADLKADRADIIDVASNIKLNLERAEANLIVISNGGATEAEINAEKESIERIKNQFSNLEEKTKLSDENIAKEEAVLAQLPGSSSNKQLSYQELAAENSEILSSANKAMSVYYSKIGILDNKLINLYRGIGQSISNEYYTDNECRKAAKKKSNLCKIIQSIKSSIDYNLKLTDIQINE